MITEKDLKLLYLQDTGNKIIDNKFVEIEDTIETDEVTIEVTCENCGETWREFEPPRDKNIELEYNVDCIDENFHNWCIEKLLEYKNNEQTKSNITTN